MHKLIFYSILLSLLAFVQETKAQLPAVKNFTRQDSLRGSVTPERAWWDVVKYDLFVEPELASKTIKGSIVIVYKVVTGVPVTKMQIDLQQPMQIDKVTTFDGATIRLMNKPGSKETTAHQLSRSLAFHRDGNVYYLDNAPSGNKIDSIKIEFSGSPKVAVNPPWDGGWIFTKDAKGQPWMTVACQGLGASVWYPCKDHQSDEPDAGAIIRVKVPTALTAVANGRLIGKQKDKDKTTWIWSVVNPINNYNIVPYIGHYTNWTDTFRGENGKSLSLSYWVLNYNLAKSKKQFGQDVKRMLKAFEYWFGPYPFYEDGYKLVESPHLGMEHQSAIAYGNRYMNGYMGMDLSGSGWGNKWDYIIIHESGHEWFANNITTKDIADMWIHEGFTMYSEILFTEYYYGKQAGDEYLQGIRNDISNDKPLIGPYGVNEEGSSDMYNKGANLLHTIRQVIGNDSLFRKILRGLNKDFYHRVVTSKDVETYISQKSGKDLSAIFDQYLRMVNIPVLEYKIDGKKTSYRWNNVVPGFAMPVKLDGNVVTWLHPTTQWQEIELSPGNSIDRLNKNFYVTVKKVN